MEGCSYPSYSSIEHSCIFLTSDGLMDEVSTSKDEEGCVAPRGLSTVGNSIEHLTFAL